MSICVCMSVLSICCVVIVKSDDDEFLMTQGGRERVRIPRQDLLCVL